MRTDRLPVADADADARPDDAPLPTNVRVLDVDTVESPRRAFVYRDAPSNPNDVDTQKKPTTPNVRVNAATKATTPQPTDVVVSAPLDGDGDGVPVEGAQGTPAVMRT